MFQKKPLKWNPEKNTQLMKERGISFESIVVAMESGQLITSYPHPRMPHQKIFEVELNGYIIVVPYVEDADYIFLKTAFHNRKATKRVRKGAIT